MTVRTHSPRKPPVGWPVTISSSGTARDTVAELAEMLTGDAHGRGVQAKLAAVFDAANPDSPLQHVAAERAGDVDAGRVLELVCTHPVFVRQHANKIAAHPLVPREWVDKLVTQTVVDGPAYDAMLTLAVNPACPAVVAGLLLRRWVVTDPLVSVAVARRASAAVTRLAARDDIASSVLSEVEQVVLTCSPEPAYHAPAALALGGAVMLFRRTSNGREGWLPGGVPTALVTNPSTSAGFIEDTAGWLLRVPREGTQWAGRSSVWWRSLAEAVLTRAAASTVVGPNVSRLLLERVVG